MAGNRIEKWREKVEKKWRENRKMRESRFLVFFSLSLIFFPFSLCNFYQCCCFVCLCIYLWVRMLFGWYSIFVFLCDFMCVRSCVRVCLSVYVLWFLMLCVIYYAFIVSIHIIPLYIRIFFLINEKKYCLFPSVNLYCPMNLSRNPIIKNLKIHYLLQKNVTLKINTKRIIFAVLNYTSCTQRKESFHLLI